MSNNIVHFNDFRVFPVGEQTYIFDIENGRIVRVDARTLRIIKNNDLPKNVLYHKCGNEFELEEFETLLDSMERVEFLSYVEKAEKARYVKEDVVGITLMLVQGCNLACSYCFGDEGSYYDAGKMTKEVAFAAIDYLVDHTSKEKVLVTFFGGEPLLAVDLIEQIIDYCKTKDKVFTFSMTTNGTLVNDEISKLIVDNKISTIISIDGNKEKNDINRYYKNGKGSYNETIKQTEFLRNEYGVTSRATLTPKNLDMIAIFEHMDRLGFKNVPMTPANNLLTDLDYLEYINSDIRLVEYAVELIQNKKYEQVKKLTFIYSALISLHYGVDRKFGCGAGIRDVAIDIHGDIYPCHRFVSCKETCIGNLFYTFEENEKQRESYLDKSVISNIKSNTICSKCWIRRYCAGGCVSENYDENKDLLAQAPRSCFHKQTFYEKLISVYIGLDEDDKKNLFGD